MNLRALEKVAGIEDVSMSFLFYSSYLGRPLLEDKQRCNWLWVSEMWHWGCRSVIKTRWNETHFNALTSGDKMYSWVCVCVCVSSRSCSINHTFGRCCVGRAQWTFVSPLCKSVVLVRNAVLNNHCSIFHCSLKGAPFHSTPQAEDSSGMKSFVFLVPFPLSLWFSL